MLPRFLSRLPMRLSNIVIRTNWFSQCDRCDSSGASPSFRPTDVLHPQLGSTRDALELPLHGGRHHVHLQELVHLVGGDLGFVAFPKTAVDAGRQRPPGHPGEGPTGRQCAPGRLARIGPVPAHALGGPQVFLDLLIATDPDLGAEPLSERRPSLTPGTRAGRSAEDGNCLQSDHKASLCQYRRRSDHAVLAEFS